MEHNLSEFMKRLAQRLGDEELEYEAEGKIKEYGRKIIGPPPPRNLGAFMSSTIDGDTAHASSPHESNTIRNPSMIKVKVFEKKLYTSTENFEEDINDFMEYVTKNGLQGSLTLFENMVYVVYHKK